MRIRVRTIESMIEPRQPKRFEKKKNTPEVYRARVLRTPQGRLALLGRG